MQTTPRNLPSDPDQLRALLAQAQADLAAKEADLTDARATIAEKDAALRHRDLELEKLKVELARLKRMRFGRSSEKLDRQIAQLELLIEEVETPPVAEAPDAPAPAKPRPARKELPAHLLREPVIHDAGCNCPTQK